MLSNHERFLLSQACIGLDKNPNFNCINRGGKLGRRKGSIKTAEQKKEEYKEVISLLKRGYSIRNVAKLTGFSIQTVQTVKNQFVNT